MLVLLSICHLLMGALTTVKERMTHSLHKIEVVKLGPEFCSKVTAHGFFSGR